jgi:hypothetical protein
MPGLEKGDGSEGRVASQIYRTLQAGGWTTPTSRDWKDSSGMTAQRTEEETGPMPPGVHDGLANTDNEATLDRHQWMRP